MSMGGEPAPATPAVAGVTFSLPRRGRGNFSTLVNPKSCLHTRKENSRSSNVDFHGRNIANQVGIYHLLNLP